MNLVTSKGRRSTKRFLSIVAATASLAAMLTACGGGTSSGPSTLAPSVPAPIPAPTPAPTSGPAPAPATATLTWTPPTVNTDGSAASDLTGYRIYYGTDATNLAQSIDVAGPAITSYVVAGLAPGTYYFAVAAVSSSGGLGVRTNAVSTVVQ